MTGDSAVREIFNMLVDFFSFIVSQMKRIPTGFGVDLYTFCIACIITSVVVVGVVNVVKVAPDGALSNIISDDRFERRSNARTRRRAQQKEFEEEYKNR